jgi:hypothetical protein
LEDRVESDAEEILHHTRNDAFESGRGELKARICIDLYQPRLEAIIHYEIKAEQLKPVGLPFRIQLIVRSIDSNPSNLFHFLIQLLHRVAFIRILFLNVSLKFRVGDLISIFKFTIVVALLLDGVVREMDEEIVEVF